MTYMIARTASHGTVYYKSGEGHGWKRQREEGSKYVEEGFARRDLAAMPESLRRDAYIIEEVDPFGDGGGGLSQPLTSSSDSAIQRILDKLSVDENTSVHHSELEAARREMAALKGGAVRDIVETIKKFAEENEFLPWRPIEEIMGDGDGVHPPRYGDQAGFLLLAPDLVDEDCNVHGVGMGYWQDDGKTWNMSQEDLDARDPDRDYSCWMACKWDMHNDEWRLVSCEPTHYIRLTGVQPLETKP